MSYYEYKVVPAPAEAPRIRGLKGTAARYAEEFGSALNEHGVSGWEFQRIETLKVSGKAGPLSRVKTQTVQMMVFRRWVETSEITSGDPRGTVPARDEAADVDTPRLTARRPIAGRLRRTPGTDR